MKTRKSHLEKKFSLLVGEGFFQETLLRLRIRLRLKRDGFSLSTDKCHTNIKSKFYQRPKSDAMCFAIHHFGTKTDRFLPRISISNFKFLAGRVVYQADGFLEKNKNFLPAEVIHLVRQSQYDM